MFSENFKVTAAPIAEGVHAFIIDNALADPDALIQFATKAKAAFREASPANFPGSELRMTDAFSAKFEDFFRLYIRKFFDARRTQTYSTRLSKVTRQPNELHPFQWLPQCDPQSTLNGHATVCFELHLFKDESLGGSGFYMPRVSFRELATLHREAHTLQGDEFAAKHDIARGFCVESSACFELTQIIPAKFNRLVFYDGAMFRAPHITAPEKLTSEPANARLMLLGNFLCKRHSDGRANRWRG